MLMLQMAGGLGNQMFQYALYLALLDAGKEVCVEDVTHYREIGRTDNRLERVFPISYVRGSRKEYIRLTDSSMMPISRVRRKLFGRKGKIFQEKNPLVYEEKIWEQQDAYCIGYWQSQQYFENVKDKLREQYQFQWEQFSEQARDYRRKIGECKNPISIHVRRGDYLSPRFAPLYGGICTEEYYKAALSFFREKFSDCTFFLFTNDPAWGRTVADGDIVLVDCGDEGGEQDMALMSSCSHHIMANSSFSWWGAWLGQNKEKIVIAPDKWLNHSEGQGIYAQLEMIRINAAGEQTERRKQGN